MSLLLKLKSSFLSRNKVNKICFIGLDRAGKSSIVKWLVEETFDEHNNKRTVGMEVAKLEATGLQFIAWDIGGQRAFRDTIWQSYLQGAKAIIYVIDSTDLERLEESRKELEKYVFSNKAFCTIPILLLANKQDLPNAKPPLEIDFLMKFITKKYNNVKLFGISCKTGENISESFNWLCNQLDNSENKKLYFPPQYIASYN